MSAILRRREFFRMAAACGGAMVLAGRDAPAGAAMAEWKSLVDVDPALFSGLNRVKNPKSLSPLERLHVPVIRVPERLEAGKPFAVDLFNGEMLHPMLQNHYIHYIALFAGNLPAGRAEFVPTLNEPIATFHLVLDKPVTLVARQYCNVHGLWESRRTLAFG